MQSTTLTLVLPDSARALDTVTFPARYSDSILPSWKFEWQFGDSTRATTTDTSVAHVYDSAGIYTVQVTLADSTGKTIATAIDTLHVAALHFNLTLLQAMHWVSIECYGVVDSSWQGQTDCNENSGSLTMIQSEYMEFQNITWNKTGFNESHSEGSPDYDSAGWPTILPSIEWSNRDSIMGSIDTSHAQITDFRCEGSVINWNYYSSEIAGDKNGKDLEFQSSASNIQFRSESDTDVVFEEFMPHAIFNQTIEAQWQPRCWGWADMGSQINFADSSVISYIRIRFHK